MSTKSLRAVLALTLTSGLVALGASPAQAAAPEPAASAASQPANAVRPEFAAPFTAAQTAMKAGQGAESLAKLKEAEAVGNLSPYEAYLVQRVRAPALYATGDLPGAERDFEAVLANPLLPAEDRLPMTKALATIYYTDKQYEKAVVHMQQFQAGGGKDAQIDELLPQTLYMIKKYPEAAKAFSAQVEADVAAGRKPAEKTLRLLASAQSQANDDEGYTKTLERLAVNYPSADYWNQLIARAERAGYFGSGGEEADNSGHSENLTATEDYQLGAVGGAAGGSEPARSCFAPIRI